MAELRSKIDLKDYAPGKAIFDTEAR